MNYTCKHLRKDDAALLKDLIHVFGEAFGEPHTNADKIARDGYLRFLLENRNFISIVALAEGAVVGGLAAYELPKYEQERSEIYLYDLAVAVAYRRRGIATALVTDLKRIARERGAYTIFVQADKQDTGAIKLYQSLTTHQENVFHFDIDT